MINAIKSTKFQTSNFSFILLFKLNLSCMKRKPQNQICDLTYNSFIFVMQKTLFRLSYMTHTFDDFTFTFLPMLCPLSSDSTAVVRCLLHQCVPLHNKENPTFLLWHLVYSRKCSRHRVYPYSELDLCFL